jgi:hypothetical protein
MFLLKKSLDSTIIQGIPGTGIPGIPGTAYLIQTRKGAF